ncbi:hypothetical protein HMPREF3155_00335 [Corynebacterium sp. HMSC06D04]|mgnify:CR=1 FL=1|uniref:Secreted protein n=2 Tax=Corynebacterium TaxID=1716 RepID=A0A2A4AIM4_9CORY|nr:MULTISPECIES: hypothetical protein [Corynebacterium]MDU3174582.1 hypothetical protein [Corynebacterium striatum]PCC82332.1 hypothetical protein COM45_08440 [Corynebacterium accolens]AMO89500.1 putative secreted protein [Corynebacterium simulans]AMO92110.1 putative secreted protein [Corynebacterium simulans]KXU17302.1 putative secreted protein [Corynebacterium simulans]
MQPLKTAARRGAIISVTALSALALASCSAGHITQTSQKVAAVDGSSAATEDGAVAVRDVTIQVEPDSGETSLKFVAVNQGYDVSDVTLESVSVDGQDVELGSTKPMARDQSIIADSAKNLEELKKDKKNKNVQYVETSLENEDFGYAGSRPVTFTFNNGTIEVDAAVAASPLKSGEYNRDVESTEGFTTESPEASHH